MKVLNLATYRSLDKMQNYKLQYIDSQAKKHSRMTQAKGFLQCLVLAGLFIAPMFIW